MKYCNNCNAVVTDYDTVCIVCGKKLDLDEINKVQEKEKEEKELKKRELEELNHKYESIMVTTTNSFEGWEIVEYIDVITKQIVVGAGLYTEFFAGLADTFGGRSIAVESRLNELAITGRQEIGRIAYEMSADAVVGYSIDIDEISGKNTFMFMINVMGTAVKIKRKSK